MSDSFKVTKCIECPAISRNEGLVEFGQVVCNVLDEPVFAEIMATNCPFVSGEGYGYKKQRRVGG